MKLSTNFADFSESVACLLTIALRIGIGEQNWERGSVIVSTLAGQIFDRRVSADTVDLLFDFIVLL